MNARPEPTDREEAFEIQSGEPKSISKQERLKRAIKQHPQRDVPRIDGEVTEEREEAERGEE